MLAGVDIATLALFMVGAVAAFFLIDLLFAGGAMSGGMASGACGMMGGLAGGMAGAWWLLIPLLAVVIIGLLSSGMLGPTSPIGPTAIFSSDWLIAMLAVPVVLILVIVTLVVLSSRSTANHRGPLSAEEILRQRYARGEINRQQYVDALVDVLKDRCARGEIGLDEYERRFDLLVQETKSDPRRELK